MTRTPIRRVAVVAIALGLALTACSGDDGEAGEAGSTTAVAPDEGSITLEAAQGEPCGLLTAADAVTAIGEGAERTGTEDLCTYANEGGTLTVQVTQIVDGTTVDSLGEFRPVNGVGDAAGYETLDGADSGRLIAIQGGALLTLAITREGSDDDAIRVAASTLAKSLLERLEPIEPLPAPDPEDATPPPAESCPIITPEALSEAIDLELELGPAGEGTCSFVVDDTTIVVGPRTDGVTERQFELGLANTDGAVEAGFDVVEVAGLGDRAVLVRRDIGPDVESGQLSVLAGETLLAVSADRVADSEAVTIAVARAVLAL